MAIEAYVLERHSAFSDRGRGPVGDVADTFTYAVVDRPPANPHQAVDSE